MQRFLEQKTKINKAEESYQFNVGPIAITLSKKCPLSLEIDRISFHDEESLFHKYFSDDASYTKIRSDLNDKKYSVGDTGITSRVLNHWQSEKILPDGLLDTNNSWKRFSSVELVWLMVVNNMREYGFPLSKIEKVKSWVLQFDSKNATYPWFEYYCALALTTHDDPFVIILSDGTAELGTSEDIEFLKYYSDGISNHMLLISLKNIMKEIGFNVKPVEMLNKLTDAEQEIRCEVLSGRVREMKIKAKNGKISELEPVEPINMRTGVSSVIKKLEEPGVYGDLLVKFSDGKVQSAEMKRKRRIKD